MAGFDLTFSVPKSVSVAWALADPTTRQAIHAAHQRAVMFVLAYAEDTVFATRTGAAGAVREPVQGVVAAAFDHWDSRAGDPQLHTHLAVLNRARAVGDGRWRTLDSRAIFGATVTLSELHNGVLADQLTAALGWGWVPVTRAHSPERKWEVAGVPAALRAEFSQRSGAIEAATEVLIGQARDRLGREPTVREVIVLRQQATPRPAKTKHSLADLVEDWTSRARPHLEGDPAEWVRSLAAGDRRSARSNGDLDPDLVDAAARHVLGRVAEHRSTFTAQNALAETFRALQAMVFTTPDERVTAAERIADRALAGAVRLTDGPDARYTTHEVLNAEERLLDYAHRDRPGPRVGPIPRTVDGATSAITGATVSVEQADAVEAIARSGRALDLLVGPAGTGKSTTMAALREVWEAAYGVGTVVGLAPSAAAADVLAEALGIRAENTAKWLTEQGRQVEREAELDRFRTQLLRASPSLETTRLLDAARSLSAEIARWQPRPGQLVIVDEASLAGTLDLARLSAVAIDAGAKVLLVGDPHPLSPVPAGGAFRLLIADRAETTPEDPAPELTRTHRFSDPWEASATRLLRDGHPVAADLYLEKGRVVTAPREAALDLLHAAWADDVSRGLTSLMVATDQATITDLNARAHQDRVRAGQVTFPTRYARILGDDTHAGVGDHIITRNNQRRLTSSDGGWVKNGDRWTVTGVGDDGSLVVRGRGRSGRAGRTITLPSDYVNQHVQLGYAVTAHRAQGATVDTTHAYVSDSTTREALYVMATRGRHANRLYVDIDDHLAVTDAVDDDPTVRGREVLRHAITTSATDISATETARYEDPVPTITPSPTPAIRRPEWSSGPYSTPSRGVEGPSLGR